MSLKINLGSGYKRIEGFLNVDDDPLVNPDYIVNLDYKKYHELVTNKSTGINIKDKKCQCGKSRPTFNEPGKKAPICCNQCKKFLCKSNIK